MLVVTIELWPGGDHTRRQILYTGAIGKDRTSTSTIGNYSVALSHRDHQRKRVWRKGRVEGFPRKRLNAWDLLYRALHNIVGDRNGTSKMAR